MFLIFFQLRIPNEHFTNQFMWISSVSTEGELHSLEKTMTNTQKTISNQKNCPILALTLLLYSLMLCYTIPHWQFVYVQSELSARWPGKNKVLHFNVQYISSWIINIKFQKVICLKCNTQLILSKYYSCLFFHGYVLMIPTEYILRQSFQWVVSQL